MARPPYKLGKFVSGMSRLQVQAQNNLGIIMADQMVNGKLYRKDILDTYDAYYENRQYDDLIAWDDAGANGQYTPVRKRKPRIIYNLAKVLSHKVAAKITGSAVFPKFVIEDDPDDTSFFRTVMKAAGFRRNLVDPVRQLLISGSVFVRFYLVEGGLHMEWVNSKYCYPIFDEKGELVEIEVKYVYEDPNDKDGSGKFRKKWYRLLLTQTTDVLFDNPQYHPGNNNPEFKIVDQVEHGLGWVQGEWLRTGKNKFDPDGPSIIGDILGFIDEFNYSLSQTSQAVGYNQEPQLSFNNMDEDELDNLIRSSEKAWNLGREGEAKFLESTMKGVEAAHEARDRFKVYMLDVVRIVLLDPEKLTGAAQSGKAMEIMHGPLVELIDELRSILEPSLQNLLIKMAMTVLIMTARGIETDIEIPKGYQPQSLDLVVQWPPIFPLTIEDIQKKAMTANTLSMANIVSRESLTRWIAPDLGIEDIDEELSKISSQPQLNPFGSFGGGGF